MIRSSSGIVRKWTLQQNMAISPNASSFSTTLGETQTTSYVGLLYFLYFMFTKYLWYIPTFLGLLGNSMSILVALQKGNRKLSNSIYIVALASADSLTLAENNWAYNVAFGYYNLPRSETQLQGIMFISYSGGIMSGLFLMEMTVDRLIAVRFPMEAKTRCTTNRAIKAVLATAIFVFIGNLHIFFCYKNKAKFDAGVSIGVHIPGHPFLESLVLAYQLAVGTLIPFIVIVICNIVIIATLRNAAKSRGHMGVDNKTRKTQGKETRYLTRMLILVCIAYVFTSIPYRTYDLVLLIPQLGDMYDMKDPYWKNRYQLQYWVLCHLWEWNFAINFYLYCLGGGRKYRSDVKRLFSHVFKCFNNTETI